MFDNLDTGVPETLENYRGDGKWLVVMIWASDCEICKREAGSYQQFHEDHKAVDAKVVGITLDGLAKREDAGAFVAQHGLGFANLIGEPEAVTAYYQIVTGSPWIGTPSFLVFGPDGELMAKQEGAVPTDLIEDFIAANSDNQ
ncbi:MAG: TlpA family protein disulfide reductase [Gammaproteobacteria bacterium]|nr:TlpA family protein disulfide reductase [Gammaproteobacteria bacterium]MDH3449790.1 TlpA family protein disulfide reductase [Gammaproteobacteria bacterium]